MPLVLKASSIFLITFAAMLVSPLTLAVMVWLARAGMLPLAVLLTAAITISLLALITRRQRPTD